MSQLNVVKLLLFALFFELLIYLTGHNQQAKSALQFSKIKLLPQLTTSSFISQRKEPDIEHIHFQYIEDWMIYLMRHSNYEKNQRIIENLLKNKLKLRRMAEACLDTNDLTDGKFTIQGSIDSPILLEAGVYLIKLNCMFGRAGDRFRLFKYTDLNGVDVKPLILTVAFINASEKLSFKDTRELFGFKKSYNINKRELLISNRCNLADGYIASLTKYRYENGRFLLSDFWQDERSNVDCLKKLNLQHLYP